jgi:hypothetical protein
VILAAYLLLSLATGVILAWCWMKDEDRITREVNDLRREAEGKDPS